MKKRFISSILLMTLSLGPCLHADEQQSDQPKIVEKRSDTSERAAKSQRWKNIALAAGAITAAVVVAVLVAQNDGRHAHHKDSNNK